MGIEYQFTDPTKWSLVWNEEYTGQPVINVLNRYYPIGRKTVGTQLSSKKIAVFCANNEAQGNWRYGARFFAKLRTGLIVQNNLPDTVFKVGKIYLDQVEIIDIPNITQEYSLEIDIPYWHRHFQVIVWEYIGNNQNTIDRKLDDLIGNPLP